MRWCPSGLELPPVPPVPPAAAAAAPSLAPLPLRPTLLVQALVLQALRGEQAPEASGALLVRLAFPEAMGSADGDTATGEAASSGVDPVSFRKLTAVQQEQLTNAVHGAARQLAHEARAASQPLLAYSIVEGREQAAAAQLLDAVVWLARQTPAPVEPGLAAQLLEEVGTCWYERARVLLC